LIESDCEDLVEQVSKLLEDSKSQFTLLDFKSFSVFQSIQTKIESSKCWVQSLKSDGDPFDLLKQLKEDNDDVLELVGASLMA
jgi:hypothetical protein